MKVLSSAHFSDNVASPPQTTRAAPDTPLDVKALRTCLGQMATGVTVITTCTESGDLVGLTANSFSALSLDPPLILWSLRLASPSLAVFQQQERFVVNILGEAQTEISRQFATSLPNKFEGASYALNAHGLPMLHSACAWFECRTISQQIAGDHCLFIAQVERFSQSEAAPLVFHSGGYFALGSRL